MKNPRYEVTGHVQNIGRRAHIIRATDSEAAGERFRRAYSKHNCTDMTSRWLPEEVEA